ncbi:MAG: hypothetical protein K4571_00365 [Deltaproteobacteria bacterium]
MAKNNVLPATIFVQKWGEEGGLIEFPGGNPHAISIFHVIGRHSYIVDSNSDDRGRFNDWSILQIQGASSFIVEVITES